MTLTEPLAWNGTTLIKGDVPEAVARLKEQPGGDILLLASARLVQTPVEQDLVDKYRLRVAPAVEGVVALTYRATGNQK